MTRLPRIAISIGDPAGIGAEIALKALQDQSVSSLAEWLLIADSAALSAAQRVSGIDPALYPVRSSRPARLPPITKLNSASSAPSTVLPPSLTSGALLNCA
jgi:4-hydroxy-L-threonine phosphate dehydrogenase PdxA